MVETAPDSFATSMQPYSSQPHLSKETHLLIRIVSIGPPHMESPRGFLKVPLKWGLPTFHYRILLSTTSPLRPLKDKQDFNTL